MRTCGYIKVQPDGLKEKAAKSMQRWDPVSKRMITMYQNTSIITILNTWNMNYDVVTELWKQSKSSPVRLQFYTNTTNSFGGAVPLLDAVVLNGNEGMNTYVMNYTGIFRNYYFFTVQELTCNFSENYSNVYQLNWFVNSWVPNVIDDIAMTTVRGIAIDTIGNIYTSDSNPSFISSQPKRIIKTTPSGVSTVFCTITDYSNWPLGLTVYSNNLYVTYGSTVVDRFDISTGARSVFISSGSVAGNVRSIIFDSLGNAYLMDSGGNMYKRPFNYSSGTIGVILATSGRGTCMGYYKDSLNDEYIYYANTISHNINKMRVLTNGSVPASFESTLVAGTGIEGFSGDGGPAVSCRLKNPRAVTVDTRGNMLVLDNENGAVRYIVARTGIIYTICGFGSGAFGSPINGVVGTSSPVNFPWTAVFKDPNTAYFTDSENKVTRVLNLTGHY